MSHERTVVALFARREDAERAITGLLERGIRPEHIGYLEPLDERAMKNPAKGAAKGMEVGAVSGAVLGGVLAAAAVGLIPGIGPAVVAGSLLPVVLGAAGGATTGAVAGGLLGVNEPSEEEPYFMQEVQAGRFLVSVEVAGEETEVATLLSSSGAFEVDRLGTATLHARLRHPRPEGTEKQVS
jgi:hypothetical protein